MSYNSSYFAVVRTVNISIYNDIANAETISYGCLTHIILSPFQFEAFDRTYFLIFNVKLLKNKKCCRNQIWTTEAYITCSTLEAALRAAHSTRHVQTL